MTAGIEGGSKSRIEAELGLADYAELKDYWRDNPPPHIMLHVIAAANGVDLEKLREPDGGDKPYGELKPKGGLTIAELAAMITPPPADETSAASNEIFRLMDEEKR